MRGGKIKPKDFLHFLLPRCSGCWGKTQEPHSGLRGFPVCLTAKRFTVSPVDEPQNLNQQPLTTHTALLWGSGVLQGTTVESLHLIGSLPGSRRRPDQTSSA